MITHYIIIYFSQLFQIFNRFDGSWNTMPAARCAPRAASPSIRASDGNWSTPADTNVVIPACSATISAPCAWTARWKVSSTVCVYVVVVSDSLSSYLMHCHIRQTNICVQVKVGNPQRVELSWVRGVALSVASCCTFIAECVCVFLPLWFPCNL